jgi:hypothetical protein
MLFLLEVPEPINTGPFVNVEPEETTILVALAAPNTGVTRVGEVENTAEPEPVSSVSAADRLADVKEPNDVVVLLDVIAPVRLVVVVAGNISSLMLLFLTPAAMDVTELTDVISPVRLGILVVEVAVPVSAPTNVVAVTTPVTLTSPATSSFAVGFVVPIPRLPET